MGDVVENQAASKQPSINEGLTSPATSSSLLSDFEDNRGVASSRMKIAQLAKNFSDDSNTAQFKAAAENFGGLRKSPIQRKGQSNLPENIKSGVENLSGIAMNDVNVHYNSDKPAQLQAHAYAQGTDIHVAPGQEKHIPHEAWHVVQQKQGRVKPTKQLKEKVGINDDEGLEREADVMGAKAIQGKFEKPSLIQRMVNSISPKKPAQLAGYNDVSTIEIPQLKKIISNDIVQAKSIVQLAPLREEENNLAAECKTAIMAGYIRYFSIESSEDKYTVPSDSEYEYGSAQEALSHYYSLSENTLDAFVNHDDVLIGYLMNFEQYLNVLIDLDLSKSTKALTNLNNLYKLEVMSTALNVTGLVLGVSAIGAFSAVTAGLGPATVAVAALGGVATNMTTGIVMSAMGLGVDVAKGAIAEDMIKGSATEVSVNLLGNDVAGLAMSAGKKAGMEGGAKSLGGVLAAQIGGIFAVVGLKNNMQEFGKLQKARPAIMHDFMMLSESLKVKKEEIIEKSSKLQGEAHSSSISKEDQTTIVTLVGTNIKKIDDASLSIRKSLESVMKSPNLSSK